MIRMLLDIHGPQCQHDSCNKSSSVSVTRPQTTA